MNLEWSRYGLFKSIIYPSIIKNATTKPTKIAGSPENVLTQYLQNTSRESYTIGIPTTDLPLEVAKWVSADLCVCR
jgi:hypothetical protein